MLTVEVHGLDEMLGKLTPELMDKPLRDFWQRAAIAVQSAASERAPVDTGHLRAMMGYEIDSGHPPWSAKIGYNVPEGSPLWFKARAMEYGTGRQGDPEVSHTSRHWPPGPALDVWASRHGFESGFQVARAIGVRGGLAPRKFLRGGLEAARNIIEQARERLGREIREQWER